ncbi:hypothetical protein [Thermodesulfovibrio sp. 3462-1]|uniref:Uncharacterized protein n=1 Tax=Thermodesulfovibrio obliviosus TaxID=3118332 RepID=A0AAU8GZ18_9BACT
MKVNVLDMIGIGIFVMAVLLLGIAFAFADDTNYKIPCTYWAKTPGFLGVKSKHSADFTIFANVRPVLENATKIFQGMLTEPNMKEFQMALTRVHTDVGSKKPTEAGVTCKFEDGDFIIQATRR